MENPIPNQPNASFESKQALPGATAVLVLGILSLVFMGLIGLILAIIAVSKSKEAMNVYAQNPDAYTLSSYKNLKGGRVCAIVSMSILGALIFFIIIAVVIGNM